MSTVVVPRLRSRQQLDEAPAKLVTTLISVAAAGLVDAGRFRRGRTYANEGAVAELIVDPGRLRGSVFGSRGQPYAVDLHVALVPMPATAPGVPLDRQQLAGLTPDADDLNMSCTCPDADDGPCKHAVAALLAFAAEAGDRPELLITWRGGSVGGRERAALGSRSRNGGGAPTAPPTPTPPRSPFATPESQSFFAFAGDFADAVVELAPPTLGAERLGPFDVSAMVRSAHATMRAVSDWR